jgi:hypothetical protein
MMQTYVDVNLLGNGNCSAGAILDARDGSILATSNGFTVPEGPQIAANIDDAGKLQREGCKVNGSKYLMVQAESGKFIGKNGARGICIIKAEPYIVIGTYIEGMSALSCNETVEQLRDYLVSIGG